MGFQEVFFFFFVFSEDLDLFLDLVCFDQINTASCLLPPGERQKRRETNPLFEIGWQIAPFKSELIPLLGAHEPLHLSSRITTSPHHHRGVLLILPEKQKKHNLNYKFDELLCLACSLLASLRAWLAFAPGALASFHFRASCSLVACQTWLARLRACELLARFLRACACEL